MKKRSKKGFTLAELLIVIAIIAVLIAIMFPVFGAQLDKARAAAELANVRAAYSELVANALLGTEKDLTKVVEGVITISEDDLLAACQQDTTTIETKDGTPATATEKGKNGSITVTYETYTGTFETDPDVKFTPATPEP